MPSLQFALGSDDYVLSSMPWPPIEPQCHWDEYLGRPLNFKRLSLFFIALAASLLKFQDLSSNARAWIAGIVSRQSHLLSAGHLLAELQFSGKQCIRFNEHSAGMIQDAWTAPQERIRRQLPVGRRPGTGGARAVAA
jgi:hypothetical protein